MIRLVPEVGDPPTAAGFGLWSEGSVDPFPDHRRDIADDRGIFRLSGPQPGRYRLAVRPGGPWIGGLETWLQEERTVEVPARGETEIEVPIRRGARLHLLARGPDGRPLEASCTILDAAGRPVDAWFATRHVDDPVAGTNLAPGLSTVEPALSAGVYTVRLAHAGYRTVDCNIELERGETRTMTVQLEPE